MQNPQNAARLMDEVIKKIKDAIAMHIVAELITNFTFFNVVNVRLGPGKIEIWHKEPRWRLDLFLGPLHGIVISSGKGSEDYVFKHGRWVKTTSRIDDIPGFTLKLFRLDYGKISYTSLMEDVLDKHPVWIVEGTDGSAIFAWWIRKDDLTVRKVEVKDVEFEFGYAGVIKRAKIPANSILRCRIVEFGKEIPDELFEAPPEVTDDDVCLEEINDWFKFFFGLNV